MAQVYGMVKQKNLKRVFPKTVNGFMMGLTQGSKEAKA